MSNAFDMFSIQNTGKLLKSFISHQPQKGRGLVKNLAELLGVASPQVSQFLSGVKTVTVDQAFLIARYFSWSELETEYWMALVDYERANHHEVKNHFRKKLEKIKKDSLNISKVVSQTTELSDNDKSRFYSSWIFSAVRLYCSIGDGKRVAEIHQAFLEFDPSELNEVIEFLMKTQLLKKNGLLYEMGAQRTFVPKGSPFLKQHQSNWRLRALERAHVITDEELMFTAPMSISAAGFKKIRKDLQAWIQKITEELPSYGDAEEVVCLNLDLFRVDGGRTKK